VARSNGLRESDVNLAVAKRLAGLLRAAGAEVALIREADESLLPGDPPQELTARADVANRFKADAFLSIHHNANMEDSSVNDLEVYYKLFDEGASLDLGRCLTRALAQALKRDGELRLLIPGNYRVLREARVPSVLTESSYLTHPATAVRMAAAAGVDAEAQALLTGLKAYFDLDPPRFKSIAAECDETGRAFAVSVQLARGVLLEPGMVEVTLDGRPANGSAALNDAGFLYTVPRALSEGSHAMVIRLSNTRGATVRQPVALKVERFSEPGDAPGGPAFATPPRAVEGPLQDKVIVLHPPYGGLSAAAIGPLGTRASDVSLDVARRLASLLRAQGATVFLTRDDDTYASDLNGVMLVERVHADILVALSFGPPRKEMRALKERDYGTGSLAAYVGHYPTSTEGLRLATAIHNAIPAMKVSYTGSYVVQQTSCPAVLVQPGNIAAVEMEQRFLDIESRRALARSLADAVEAYFNARPGK
jgi:N-acetylmuramoyl-L-alanine amidase